MTTKEKSPTIQRRRQWRQQRTSPSTQNSIEPKKFQSYQMCQTSQTSTTSQTSQTSTTCQTFQTIHSLTTSRARPAWQSCITMVTNQEYILPMCITTSRKLLTVNYIGWKLSFHLTKKCNKIIYVELVDI